MSVPNNKVEIKGFEKFVEEEIIPLLENYRPMNNREEWYQHWDLFPMENEDPDSYMKRLMELRKDPKVTWQFKTFILQVVSTVYYGFLKPKEEEKQ